MMDLVWNDEAAAKELLKSVGTFCYLLVRYGNAM
jgi:hypothetical protein